MPPVPLCVVESFWRSHGLWGRRGRSGKAPKTPRGCTPSPLCSSLFGEKTCSAKPRCDIDGLPSWPLRLRGRAARLARATAPASCSRKDSAVRPLLTHGPCMTSLPCSSMTTSLSDPRRSWASQNWTAAKQRRHALLTRRESHSKGPADQDRRIEPSRHGDGRGDRTAWTTFTPPPNLLRRLMTRFHPVLAILPTPSTSGAMTRNTSVMSMEKGCPIARVTRSHSVRQCQASSNGYQAFADPAHRSPVGPSASPLRRKKRQARGPHDHTRSTRLFFLPACQANPSPKSGGLMSARRDWDGNCHAGSMRSFLMQRRPDGTKRSRRV